MTTTTTIVVIVLVLLALLALAGFLAARAKRRRSEQLQGRFGPEYDREVDERGGRRAAESHLADVAKRRDRLEVRELSAQERQTYTTRWQQVQADFVDSPSAATRDADDLVGEVMRERGYPVEDFETRADMIMVDHPQVVEHYRAAHAATAEDDPTTEEQRRAFVHYRALFEELVATASAGADHETADQSAAAEPARAIRPTDSATFESDRSDLTRTGVEDDGRDDRVSPQLDRDEELDRDGEGRHSRTIDLSDDRTGRHNRSTGATAATTAGEERPPQR